MYDAVTAFTINDKQWARIDRFLEEIQEHNPGYGLHATREALSISGQREYRPGRGHLLEVVYVDSDVAALMLIDPYGHGDPTFGSVRWDCAEEFLCERCEAEAEAL